MVRLIRFALWMLARLILPFRYRVTADGLEQLRGLTGPVLILPNHPAYVDPILVLTTFWRRLRPRPLLYGANFRSPLLFPFMKLLDAVDVPVLHEASAERGRRPSRRSPT